ncbi:MAG: Na+/H+ antiporter NhaC family protein, partial [Shewanella sp.]|nr:Na+/H+ antiporter NhaC family protein [Shewanella sp.]
MLTHPVTPAAAKQQGSIIALLPLFLFLTLFIGAGLYFQSQGVDFAFYQLP